MKIKAESLRKRCLWRGRAYEKAKPRIISSIWEPEFVIRAKPSLSSDCWGSIAWRQCRPSMGTQPSVNMPLVMVGHSQTLGEAAVPLPPFPSASPDTRHCSPAAAPPSVMSLVSPAASPWGSVGQTGVIWGPGSACHPQCFWRLSHMGECCWPPEAQTSAKHCFILCLLRETESATSLETCSWCHSLSLGKQDFFWTL